MISNKLKIVLASSIVLLMTSIFYSKKISEQSKTITPIIATKPVIKGQVLQNIVLYVPNVQSGKLEKINEAVNDSKNIKEVELNNKLQKLLEKLKESSMVLDTEFKNAIYLRDNKIYLDLDSKIFSKSTTANEEVLLVYSIINTMLENTNFDSVIILKGGKQAKKFKFIGIKRSYTKNNNI